MKPDVREFFHPDTNTFSYLVSDPDSGACAVVDPVLDYEPTSARTNALAAQEVRGRGLAVEWILETHAHADHLTAAPVIREALGGKIAIGAEKCEYPDRMFLRDHLASSPGFLTTLRSLRTVALNRRWKYKYRINFDLLAMRRNRPTS